MTPELRLLAALDGFRDALGAYLAQRCEPAEPAALLTITDAAARLGLSRSTVTRWADTGRIATVGPRHARRVPRAELDAIAAGPPRADK